MIWTVEQCRLGVRHADPSWPRFTVQANKDSRRAMRESPYNLPVRTFDNDLARAKVESLYSGGAAIYFVEPPKGVHYVPASHPYPREEDVAAPGTAASSSPSKPASPQAPRKLVHTMKVEPVTFDEIISQLQDVEANLLKRVEQAESVLQEAVCEELAAQNAYNDADDRSSKAKLKVIYKEKSDVVHKLLGTVASCHADVEAIQQNLRDQFTRKEALTQFDFETLDASDAAGQSTENVAKVATARSKGNAWQADPQWKEKKLKYLRANAAKREAEAKLEKALQEFREAEKDAKSLAQKQPDAHGKEEKAKQKTKEGQAKKAADEAQDKRTVEEECQTVSEDDSKSSDEVVEILTSSPSVVEFIELDSTSSDEVEEASSGEVEEASSEASEKTAQARKVIVKVMTAEEVRELAKKLKKEEATQVEEEAKASSSASSMNTSDEIQDILAKKAETGNKGAHESTKNNKTAQESKELAKKKEEDKKKRADELEQGKKDAAEKKKAKEEADKRPMSEEERQKKIEALREEELLRIKTDSRIPVAEKLRQAELQFLYIFRDLVLANDQATKDLMRKYDRPYDRRTFFSKKPQERLEALSLALNNGVLRSELKRKIFSYPKNNDDRGVFEMLCKCSPQCGAAIFGRCPAVEDVLRQLSEVGFLVTVEFGDGMFKSVLPEVPHAMEENKAAKLSKIGRALLAEFGVRVRLSYFSLEYLERRDAGTPSKISGLRLTDPVEEEEEEDNQEESSDNQQQTTTDSQQVPKKDDDGLRSSSDDGEEAMEDDDTFEDLSGEDADQDKPDQGKKDKPDQGKKDKPDQGKKDKPDDNLASSTDNNVLLDPGLSEQERDPEKIRKLLQALLREQKVWSLQAAMLKRGLILAGGLPAEPSHAPVAAHRKVARPVQMPFRSIYKADKYFMDSKFRSEATAYFSEMSKEHDFDVEQFLEASFTAIFEEEVRGRMRWDLGQRKYTMKNAVSIPASVANWFRDMVLMFFPDCANLEHLMAEKLMQHRKAFGKED